MKFLKIAVLTSAFSAFSSLAFAEISITSSAMSLYVVGAPMNKVLDHVMISFGADAKIEPNVDQIVTSYWLRGNLSDILSKVEGEFDLLSFEFNNVIYVSLATDIETKILQIEGAEPADVIAALEASGLPVKRFSVSSVISSDAIIITAPEEFIRISEALLLSMRPQSGQSANTVKVRRGIVASLEPIR